MGLTSTVRSAAFVVLGWTLLCTPASAGVCVGAFNEVRPTAINVDGRFTNQEWSEVRPLAFKLDARTGGLFSTCREDGAADIYVYMAPNAGVLYFLYDIPGLTSVPSELQTLLSVDIPYSSGTATSYFKAASTTVVFDGLGLGAGYFGTSPNSDIDHFMFELAVPLDQIPDGGQQAIWRAAIGDSSSLEVGRFETTFDPGGAVSAFPEVGVPLAAHSLGQHVLETLKALRSSLTKKAQTDKLDAATVSLAKALDPKLYVDQGHLRSTNGDKVFSNDKNAASALLALLGQSGLPPAVLGPYGLGWCTHLLEGIAHELAWTAIFEFATNGGSATTLLKANTLLAKGEADWAALKVRAFDDYRSAWQLVKP